MSFPRHLHCQAAWPPLWASSAFVCIYAALHGAVWIINSRLPWGVEVFAPKELANLSASVIGIASVLFVLFRLFRFHPAANRPYAAWLQTTPWVSRQPLPLGPLHPVIQDVVVIGVLAAIARCHAAVDPWLPVALSLFIYLAAMTLLLALTRTRGYFLAAAFLWPALILPQVGDWQRTAILAALAAVVWLGYRSSLSHFPWNFLPSAKPGAQTSVWQTDVRFDIGELTAIKELRQLGWPYAALSPRMKSSSVSPVNALLISLLAGWVYFCVATATSAPRSPGLIIIVASLSAFVRLLLYAQFCAPSFNLLGRLSSGRLVVPGYDVVLVAPGLAIFIAFAGAWPVRLAGEHHRIVQAALLAIVFHVLLGWGPKMQTWLLTGSHRFRKPPTADSKGVVLKQV